METIVVLVVTMLSLSIILSTYSLVVRKNNINKYYNRPSEVYALYYVMKLGTTNASSYVKPSITSFYTSKSNCNTYMSTYLTNCTQVFSDLNLQFVGIVTNINNEINNNYSVYNNGTIEFLEHLQTQNVSYDNEGNAVTKNISYAIGVFYIGGEYYYASVQIDED